MPVYKAEKYLPQCIESILAQTFTDFELLLIDDGSPDRSGEICDEYVRKDHRIRVFHQQNRGVSAARNLGLEQAVGEYIAFVDSDDYVLPDYLKDLYDSLQDSGPECLVIHTVYKLYPNGDSAFCHLRESKIDGVEAFRILLDYGDKDIGYSVAKLFSNELIRSHQLRFPVGITLLEDLFFLFEYIRRVSLIKVGDVANYVYRVGYSDTTLSVAYKPLTEELCIFRVYYAYISGFVQSSGYPSDRFHKSWRGLCAFFHRVLLVLYSVKENKSYRERIACLKQLRTDYSEWIAAWFNPDYKADKVTAFFLRTGWYACVDVWMRFLLCIHFKKMFGGGINEKSRSICYCSCLQC